MANKLNLGQCGLATSEMEWTLLSVAKKSELLFLSVMLLFCMPTPVGFTMS